MYYFGVQYTRMRWLGFKMYLQKISDKDYVENKLPTAGTVLSNVYPSSCKLQAATDIYWNPYTSSDTPSIEQLNTINSAPNHHRVGRKGVCVVNYKPPGWHQDCYKIKTNQYLAIPSSSTPPAFDLKGMTNKFSPTNSLSVQEYTVPTNFSVHSSCWPCIPNMASIAAGNVTITHATSFKITTYFKFAFYGAKVPPIVG